MPAPRRRDSISAAAPPSSRRGEHQGSGVARAHGPREALARGRRSDGAPSTEDPLVGSTILGGLLLEARIGAGSGGIVYRAIERGTGARFAVKRLAPHLQGDLEARSRLRREARVSRAIAHPAVVDVRLYAEPEAFGPCLVMELLEGLSLAELLVERGRLEAVEAVDLLAPALEALGRAHARGILHRDIKPQNLFVVEEPHGPRARLLDFGLAHIDDPTSIVTGAGLIFGSAPYLSPEAARGEAIDPRADVYSLGVLLYEALSGHRPFRATSTIGLLMHHLKTTPKPIRSWPGAEGIPPLVARVVHRALEKDSNRRPPDAGALLLGLKEALAGSGARRSPDSPSRAHAPALPASVGGLRPGSSQGERRRRWGSRTLAALALATIAAVATSYGVEATGRQAPPGAAPRPLHGPIVSAELPRGLEAAREPRSGRSSEDPSASGSGDRSGPHPELAGAPNEVASTPGARRVAAKRSVAGRGSGAGRRGASGDAKLGLREGAADRASSSRITPGSGEPVPIPMPELLPYRAGGPVAAPRSSSP